MASESNWLDPYRHFMTMFRPSNFSGSDVGFSSSPAQSCDNSHPKPGPPGCAVRDLADGVIVCVNAVEGVVDVLARPARMRTTTTPRRWAYPSAYDSGSRALNYHHAPAYLLGASRRESALSAWFIKRPMVFCGRSAQPFRDSNTMTSRPARATVRL